MRYIYLIALLASCTPPPAPAPVYNCENEKLEIYHLKKRLGECKDEVISLEDHCNPAYGNWKNCDVEVYNRWYNGCSLEYDIQE